MQAGQRSSAAEYNARPKASPHADTVQADACRAKHRALPTMPYLK